jgi:predicted flap endonuclease-1-like 5' DNA nuclease
VKRYFEGFYCRDSSDLELLNKSSNRHILDALKDAYPCGMTAHQLEEKTQLPRQTIYSQLKELCRESYTFEINNRGKSKPRGRPSTKTSEPSYSRHRDEVIIEDSSNLFNFRVPFKEFLDKHPMAPGNEQLSSDFEFMWLDMAEKNDNEEINTMLMILIRRLFRRAMESDKTFIKKAIPVKHIEHCCYQCGLNYEARDFFRAILIRTIDIFESSKEYLDFLKENEFVTQDAYSLAEKRIQQTEYLEQGLRDREKGKNEHKVAQRKKGSQITVTNLPTNPRIDNIEGIGPSILKKLHDVGISSLKDLALSNVEQLAEKINCTKDTARSFILAAQKLLRETETTNTNN